MRRRDDCGNRAVRRWSRITAFDTSIGRAPLGTDLVDGTAVSRREVDATGTDEAGPGGGGARGYGFGACNASNMEQIRAAMRLLYADSATSSGQ